MTPLVMQPEVSAESLADLHDKLDALTAQVAFLAEEARQQRRQRQEWLELRDDMTPVAMEMYQLAVSQLSEVEPHVQFEDILHLFKRLLRNTRNLEQMLDQFESLAEMGSTLSPLSQEAFVNMMTRLDAMERKGYFAFLRGGMDIADRVVTNFTADDVAQLGDNVVLILETVKDMTQPEVMRLLRRTALVAREEEPAETPSLLSIVRQLNDPAVRRGLAKTLHILKTVSDE